MCCGSLGVRLAQPGPSARQFSLRGGSTGKQGDSPTEGGSTVLGRPRACEGTAPGARATRRGILPPRGGQGVVCALAHTFLAFSGSYLSGLNPWLIRSAPNSIR